MSNTKNANLETVKQIEYLSRALKAPRIREAATRLGEQARESAWTHEEYLAAVLSREVSARDASGAELRIRGAHLPLRYVSGAVALDGPTLRRVVGREGDPAAFVSIRPWIGPGVQFWVDDPDDPTPYWIVSSRRPERVVELLRSASAGNGVAAT